MPAPHEPQQEAMSPSADPGALRFARRLFTVAGLYGLLVLTPNLFLEPAIARATAPFTHVLYFYGFLGVALTWQLLFLLIGRDPVRYRAVMPIGALEKISLALPAGVLMRAGRGESGILPFVAVDLLFGALFLLAWWRLRQRLR